MKFKLVVLLSVLCLLFSCSSRIIPIPPPAPTENQLKGIFELSDNQKQGKALFEANCANCHGLHKPSDYKPEKWTLILKKMIPNTELDEEQTALVYDYLTSGI